MDLFVRLLIAHLLGDFVLQRERWVQMRDTQIFRSWHLYIHALIHGLLAFCLAGDLSFWPFALFIMLSHFAIDAIKALIGRRDQVDNRLLFGLDQLGHIVMIALSVWMYANTFLSQPVSDIWASLIVLADGFPWAILAAYIFVIWPAAVIVRVFISPFVPPRLQNDDVIQPDMRTGLPKAGRWIGILERVLIVTLMIANQFGAIGFLIAAKSIFRFGNLKDQKDMRLAEYMLIGTLLSFGLAVAAGIFATMAIQ